MAAYDVEDWAYPEEEIDSDPDAKSPSELEPTPVGEMVSVHSSLNWEVVTMPRVTFRGVPLVTRAAVVGVLTPRGM